MVRIRLCTCVALPVIDGHVVNGHNGVASECFMVGHVTAGAYAVLGGCGGMLPRENLNFRPSKAVFGAF